MIQSSNRVNWEDIWMIVDDLKWFKEKMKYNMFIRENAIKYKRKPIGILTTSWVTNIGLKWFLSHFEANT